MNINNINGAYSGYVGYDKSLLKKENNNLIKDNFEQSGKYKDCININESARNFGRVSKIGGLTIDKGTAAHTTLYVDRASYDKILNYTTNNKECQWEEMGVDDEKRWVVVNGQRFECPLSEEEKELRRRLSRTMLDFIEEADKEKEKHKPDKNNYVELSFGENNKFNVEGSGEAQSNSKIKSLIKNDKVMKMLNDITKINGGQGIKLGV